MNIYLLKKINFFYILLIYLVVYSTSLKAYEVNDNLEFENLFTTCYSKTESCKSFLLKLNNYQKNAAKNKKFSCQTRLLGLEANLIMAMNFTLKKEDVRKNIKAVRKYC